MLELTTLGQSVDGDGKSFLPGNYDRLLLNACCPDLTRIADFPKVSLYQTMNQKRVN